MLFSCDIFYLPVLTEHNLLRNLLEANYNWHHPMSLTDAQGQSVPSFPARDATISTPVENYGMGKDVLTERLGEKNSGC